VFSYTLPLIKNPIESYSDKYLIGSTSYNKHSVNSYSFRHLNIFNDKLFRHFELKRIIVLKIWNNNCFYITVYLKKWVDIK